MATLSSTVGGHTTSINTQQSSINGLNGKYGVTINANGAITGFELNNGTGGSNFIVSADTFKIKTSSGTLTPFTVSGNTVSLSNVSVSGNFALGNSPVRSGSSMTGIGAALNNDGTFALGNSSKNISFDGTTLTINGDLVTTGNIAADSITIAKMAPGASLPAYVRTYKGSYTPTVPVNSWLPLELDASALNNRIGATDYDTTRVLLPAGTYFYELSVPVKCQGSDTNDACYTAIIENPLDAAAGGSYVTMYDGEGGSYEVFVPAPYDYPVLSTAGVNVVGDWQTATIFGVGKFTLASSKYISAAVKTTDSGPAMNVVARTGFCTTILRIWRDYN